ncbi:hypothetical protein [uncultured Winogradskyella sp.]|uniref:hypothetical protein n=1 Tax=uncultured Winogradskyella sp. TaxID=395353 RepID=UPI002607B65F|nr:hypothetical protein [uncultured Winogradskyella sp.]|tara:strand:- start:6816 stop:7355 length:540 start_codon:yes stop_codon:yes gene_type:complete
MIISKKVIFGILIALILIPIGWFILYFLAVEHEETKFYNIEIPKRLNFPKPIEFLTNQQIDSLKKLIISEEKIVVVGDGYNGYSFYMWHKPIEKGEIYIKAFELTQEVRLSEWNLSNKTKNKILKLNDNYKLYEGHTVISEGTFEHYYPTRFELWFKPFNSGNEKKLTEQNYIIDGWDR